MSASVYGFGSPGIDGMFYFPFFVDFEIRTLHLVALLRAFEFIATTVTCCWLLSFAPGFEYFWSDAGVCDSIQLATSLTTIVTMAASACGSPGGSVGAIACARHVVIVTISPAVGVAGAAARQVFTSFRYVAMSPTYGNAG